MDFDALNPTFEDLGAYHEIPPEEWYDEDEDGYWDEQEGYMKEAYEGGEYDDYRDFDYY